MADKKQESAIADIPEAIAAPPRRWSMQLVWLIPLVAALIGGWLAIKAVYERGPTITISFASAEGIEAGKTKIRYKKVDIGTVSRISLSEDRSVVVVTAELTKQMEQYLVEDTRFWVVRARIAGGQVTDLGTLLSGSYIGVDIGKSTKPRRDFTGLEIPQAITADLPGRNFVLQAPDLGSLDIGSPIYFRRVQVGEVVGTDLDKDGNGVTVKIFVHAPYHHYVTIDARFWQASGIDVAIDASGFRLHSESLTTIVQGGIAFLTPPGSEPAAPADENSKFILYDDRVRAMRHPDTVTETYVLDFKESVRGLEPGAPVDFRGVVVGEVVSIRMQYDPVTRQFSIPVLVRIYPERFHGRYRKAEAQSTPLDTKKQLGEMIKRGFRAQLRIGNLLTSQLYVALDFFPKAADAKIDWTRSPPLLPTVPGGLQELQVSITEIVKKLEKVPFEAVAADLRQSLQSLDRTLRQTDKLVQRLENELAPEARDMLKDARDLFGSADRVLGRADRVLGDAGRALEPDAPLQLELRDALREVSRAAQSLRVLADYLERYPEALIRGKRSEEK